MKRILDFRFLILDDRRVPSNPNSKIQNRKYIVRISLLACLCLFSQVVEACPACSESLFDPKQLHQRLSAAKGYALSIALLLCVLFGLVGGITALVMQAQRRKSQPVDTHTLSR